LSRLTDLIAHVKASDPQMGADLEAEFRALTRTRNFGLIFEKHKPEIVELPQRPVRNGDKVWVLPPRGTVTVGDQRLWSVSRVERVDAGRFTLVRQ
jgi:adenine-specific DNA-methyltransferase